MQHDMTYYANRAKALKPLMPVKNPSR